MIEVDLRARARQLRKEEEGNKSMKYNLKKTPRLFLGFFLCATGMVMTINANLGLAPWDVLHQGMSKLIGITMGRANIMLGLIILALNALFGEKIGIGTILNIIFIGIFIDFLMLNNLIPIFNSFLPSFIMMLLGMLVFSYGCFFYIGTGWGTGPRDGLMVALTKRTGKSVRLVKSSLEILVVLVGYLLGGSVGLGTVVLSLGGGYVLQFAFKTVNFDVTGLEQRYLSDDIGDLIENRNMKKDKK